MTALLLALQPTAPAASQQRHQQHQQHQQRKQHQQRQQMWPPQALFQVQMLMPCLFRTQIWWQCWQSVAKLAPLPH